MTPICLVTGFLGCGKTTLLKRLVERYRSRKLIYLVNEFCATDIDGALVAGDDDTVVTLPGGSIFCKCLVTSFIENLRTLAGRDAEGLVIEASGMANPRVIERMLAETKLDRHYRLTEIITIVDPGTFLKLRHTLPNVCDQVAAADILVINKTDCHDAPHIAAVETEIRALNPRAAIHKTERAAIDFALFQGDPAPRGLQGDYAPCRDPNYRNAWLALPLPVDLKALKACLAHHAGQLYRAKGFVATADACHYVDLAAGTVSIQPATRTASPGLALVFPGALADRIELQIMQELRATHPRPQDNVAGCNPDTPRG